jgi:hypothetical protein
LEGITDYNPSNFTPAQHSSSCPPPIFDSCFESGNLLYAYRRVKETGVPEYDLIMQNDTNTKGYSQWFFFSLQNHQERRIKLNIVNFVKKNLLFMSGVRPVGFSMKANEKKGTGWASVGEAISYGKSFITRESSNQIDSRNYYCLSFEISFENEEDLVYIAYNYPYTYSKMIAFTDDLVTNSASNEEISVIKKVLCYSVSNNAIPYLIIEHKYCKSGKIVLCIGRQHGGETVGSYVLEGFLKHLVNNRKLVQEYTFIVVPMVNVDGVIYGNFRANLSGFDLNRQWCEPNRWLHP